MKDDSALNNNNKTVPNLLHESHNTSNSQSNEQIDSKNDVAEIVNNTNTQKNISSQATTQQQNAVVDDKNAIIKIVNLNKTFKVGIQEVQVLKNVNVKFNLGDFTVILGPSGCGKSTLLHILLGLEVPTSGKVLFLGDEIYANTDEDQRSDLRKRHIGMMFQQANWIKSLRVLENVAFPLILLGMEKAQALARAYDMLEQMDMSKWAYYFPTELSGGQQQRVSLARALVNSPGIIVADEPTGNLDYKAGQDIMKLLVKLNKEKDITVIMVTHDLEYLSFAKSAIRMLDGEVIGVYNQDEKAKLISELQFKRTENVSKDIEKGIEFGRVKTEQEKAMTPAPHPKLEEKVYQ